MPDAGSTPGQGTTRDRRSGVRVDLAAGYGLVAGAALGALLLALTGDITWTAIGPGLGLLVGLVVAGLLIRRRGDDPTGDDEGVDR